MTGPTEFVSSMILLNDELDLNGDRFVTCGQVRAMADRLTDSVLLTLPTTADTATVHFHRDHLPALLRVLDAIERPILPVPPRVRGDG